ncbi:MAG: polysaccharide deacetylase family protein [Methyloligellaceae bacterium]
MRRSLSLDGTSRWIVAFSNIRRLFNNWSLVFLIGAVAACPVLAQQTEDKDVNRDILALYDSREEGVFEQSRVHKYAEMPLNHLGFKLGFHDVSKGLPPHEKMKKYRAVLTWFKQPPPNPVAFGNWVLANFDAGRHHVALGLVGTAADPASKELHAQIMRTLGLEDTGERQSITTQSRFVTRDSSYLDFEAKIDRNIPGHPILTDLGKSTLPNLQIATPLPGGELRISTLAVTNDFGGFAAEGFVMREFPKLERVRWILNPFNFFRAALGYEHFPVPDTTTISGRRLYFSHIDGDGWNNISEVEQYATQPTLSAEVVYHELIAPFPDLPVTVGLISGDVIDSMGGSEQSRRAARQLFALPQVEVGSHTHSHPFEWQFFEKYSRSEEVALIDKAENRSGSSIASLFGSVNLARLYAFFGFETRSRYTSGSDDLPRTYMHSPFDLETEVSTSLRTAENLAPPRKKAMLYQWSGNTKPFEAALTATRNAGVRNINGGDSRFDNEFPSVAYVPPIGRMVGKERQVYAVNSNENTYTHDWTANYFGQKLLKQTLVNTQTPRLLKGFNLYYHMYSGEKPAALAAVSELLEFARTQPLAPIPASQYAAIADSFFAARIQKTAEGRWRILDRRDLQTLRIDNAATQTVDMTQSTGVLGFRNVNNALYISLDGAHDTVTIAVRDTAEDTVPFLEESRWIVSDLKRHDCGMDMQATGFGSSEMSWRAMGNNAYDIAVSRSGKVLWSTTAAPDADGKLAVNAPVDARKPVEVIISCRL